MVSSKVYKWTAILSLGIILLSCTQRKPEFSPQQLAEFNQKYAEADALYQKGSYLSLREAFDLYTSLQSFPAHQSRTKTKLLKTSLLLCLRENELSIAEDRHLRSALDLIESNPEYEEYASLVSLVLFTSPGGSVNLRGSISSQYDLENFFDWIRENIVDLNSELKEKAETDVFFTYFYLTLHEDFRHNLEEEEDHFERFLEMFPDSNLIRYKMSVFPEFDRHRLESILEKDPDFWEAYYLLGNIFLLEGRVLTAEKNLIKVFDQIPKSISVLKLITKIHYMLEEFKESLEFNEKILMLTPNYRDALLGKAICLSYLNRLDEAIVILNRLIEMGMYLMGESHYWLAWNLYEKGDLSAAWENAQRAQNYLIGHSEVHSLAGKIAFDSNRIDAAEDQFKKALWINAGDCEASFYMGKIFGIREIWEQSGIHFENAALCNAGMESALIDKIKELSDSPMSEDRKQKHIARKNIQLRQVSVTKATAFFNAAAGYYNAGLTDKALHLAENAREHEKFRQMADGLIGQIKKKHFDLQWE